MNTLHFFKKYHLKKINAIFKRFITMEILPLYYGNFGFTVDVDTGIILDWPDTKLYVKVHLRAIDTGFYTFCDKDKNKIDEINGYVPDFLGITSPGYGDCINFDTDVDGFILDWKEKEIKKQVIKYMKFIMLGEKEDE